MLELDATSASTGIGSLALDVTITSPIEEFISETGAGPCVASGTNLSFTNDCGAELTLGDAEYSVDSSGAEPVLTLWGSVEFQITSPFLALITVDLEAEFELVEPQTDDDPVFDDRFEMF